MTRAVPVPQSQGETPVALKLQATTSHSPCLGFPQHLLGRRDTVYCKGLCEGCEGVVPALVIPAWVPTGVGVCTVCSQNGGGCVCVCQKQNSQPPPRGHLAPSSQARDILRVFLASPTLGWPPGGAEISLHPRHPGLGSAPGAQRSF